MMVRVVTMVLPLLRQNIIITSMVIAIAPVPVPTMVVVVVSATVVFPSAAVVRAVRATVVALVIPITTISVVARAAART